MVNELIKYTLMVLAYLKILENNAITPKTGKNYVFGIRIPNNNGFPPRTCYDQTSWASTSEARRGHTPPDNTRPKKTPTDRKQNYVREEIT